MLHWRYTLRRTAPLLEPFLASQIMPPCLHPQKTGREIWGLKTTPSISLRGRRSDHCSASNLDRLGWGAWICIPRPLPLGRGGESDICSHVVNPYTPSLTARKPDGRCRYIKISALRLSSCNKTKADITAQQICCRFIIALSLHHDKPSCAHSRPAARRRNLHPCNAWARQQWPTS